MTMAFPQAPRKVRVRPSTGGLFTKGNHFSGNTGWTTPVRENFTARNSGFYGVNSALPQAEVPLHMLKKAKPAPKRGKICPGCGIEKPLSGQCQQCW